MHIGKCIPTPGISRSSREGITTGGGWENETHPVVVWGIHFAVLLASLGGRRRAMLTSCGVRLVYFFEYLNSGCLSVIYTLLVTAASHMYYCWSLITSGKKKKQ